MYTNFHGHAHAKPITIYHRRHRNLETRLPRATASCCVIAAAKLPQTTAYSQPSHFPPNKKKNRKRKEQKRRRKKGKKQRCHSNLTAARHESFPRGRSSAYIKVKFPSISLAASSESRLHELRQFQTLPCVLTVHSSRRIVVCKRTSKFHSPLSLLPGPAVVYSFLLFKRERRVGWSGFVASVSTPVFWCRTRGETVRNCRCLSLWGWPLEGALECEHAQCRKSSGCSCIEC